MSNDQKDRGRLSLDEVRNITEAIAREEDPSLKVVGATTAVGAEDSSEVLLVRTNGAQSRPLVVRVDRCGSESELRPAIRDRLRAAVRANDQQNSVVAAIEATNRVDELAADLSDLQVLADEIDDQPPPGVRRETVERLKHALSDATDAADDVEDESNAK